MNKKTGFLLNGLTAVFFTILLFAGCGGGGGGGGTPDDTSPESTEISALLDSVDAGIASINATDPDERLQEIARYLASRSEFVASGVSSSTGSTWGRTASGNTICFIDRIPAQDMESIPSEEESASEPLLSSAMPMFYGAIAENRTDLPGGHNGHVASVYETKTYCDGTALGVWYFLTSSPDFPSEYKRQFDDFKPQCFQNASIERLAAMRDVGVFYMNTVVGAYKKPDDTEIVALMTSVEVTPSSEATYRSLLQDGLLVIMDAPPLQINEVSDGPRLRRFAITTKFIREKMVLAPNALAYIDAGFGNHPDLKAAFAAIGADVYLSWEKMPCDGFLMNSTALFMFDQLMGQDNIGNITLWWDSPSRPFDYQEVFTAMGATKLPNNRRVGWDKCGNIIPDAGRDPHLVLTEGSGTLAFLAPSIKYVLVDENPDNPKPEMSILHIYGSFGPDPGAGNRAVFFQMRGGTSMDIISWSPTEITCWIPSRFSSVEDPQSRTAGRFFVQRRGIVSNGATLTEWFLPIRMYNYDPNTTFWNEANFTLHLRLDIHGWRSILNQPYPLSTPPESLYNGGATGYLTSAGRYSTGSWSCGGKFHDEDTHYTILINGEVVATTVSDAWYEQSGSGSLTYQNDITGMYATVVAYHDDVTLEKPNPPAKFRVNLRYMSHGQGVNFFVDNQPYGQYSTGGNWTINLEVDYDDKDKYGNPTFAIKAGTFNQLSWQKTPAVFSTRPNDAH